MLGLGRVANSETRLWNFQLGIQGQFSLAGTHRLRRQPFRLPAESWGRLHGRRDERVRQDDGPADAGTLEFVAELHGRLMDTLP